MLIVFFLETNPTNGEAAPHLYKDVAQKQFHPA